MSGTITQEILKRAIELVKASPEVVEEELAKLAKWATEPHTIELPCYGIVVDLTGDGGGSISSDVKEVCEHCKDPECDMDCMDFGEYCSDRDMEAQQKKQEERDGFVAYNGGVDAITSMILAHAIAGIDIETPAYIEGIETAIQALGNNT